jgi:hypothetical protein
MPGTEEAARFEPALVASRLLLDRESSFNDPKLMGRLAMRKNHTWLPAADIAQIC